MKTGNSPGRVCKVSYVSTEFRSMLHRVRRADLTNPLIADSEFQSRLLSLKVEEVSGSHP